MIPISTGKSIVFIPMSHYENSGCLNNLTSIQSIFFLITIIGSIVGLLLFTFAGVFMDCYNDKQYDVMKVGFMLFFFSICIPVFILCIGIISELIKYL